ncbi:response regulator transcription factor [Caulobacter mirabilis]|uniref:Response regulatory domain-containing protein n=1 Tax=Caulobacter mirabilis TaxID=69666 RepID=A0A2D2AY57_9CAUL|nr:response regulator transcription factor [Caulobacter mirabilis]ATQ42959.1 hypothetical protein CSW64_11335 [Caulobacter mirabilis]
MSSLAFSVSGDDRRSLTRPARSLLLVDLSEGDPHDLGVYLERQGLSVYETNSLDRLYGASLKGEFNAVALVARLPNPTVLAAIRHMNGADAPPLLVVALEGEVVERVLVLEMGADDLVGRDTEAREVLARLHRLIWRRPGADAPDPRPGSAGEAWVLKNARRALITPTGRRISLTGGDQELLNAFTRREDGLVLEQDYPRGHIRTAVCRLKRKVLLGSGVELPIQNVRGEGYRFDASLVQE